MRVEAVKNLILSLSKEDQETLLTMADKLDDDALVIRVLDSFVRQGAVV
jgi:hypothetical protein